MFRPNGPRPAWVRPLRPAPDAIDKWLAFHAYRLAVGVFVQGREAEDVIASELEVGGALGDATGGEDPTAPLTWKDLKVTVDPVVKSVTLGAPGGEARTARWHGRYGCVILPPGEDQPLVPARPAVPEPRPAGAPWPAGNAVDRDGLGGHVDIEAIDAASEAVTADGKGRAFAVIHSGRLISESYAAPFTQDTPHPGWSMSKTLIGGLIGRLIAEGRLTLDTPAPVEAWQGRGDARSGITIGHLLHMSSGLDCPNGITPWAAGDRHFYVYAGAEDVRGFVTSLPSRAAPGTRCAYQNCDPNIAMGIVQEQAQAMGMHPAEAPWKLLFDLLGMNSVVLHSDPRGHYILSGFSTATALDWARFGQLYLDDGVWQGTRLLPEGWLRYAMQPAPADDEPVYGGAFTWLGQAFGEQMFGRPPHGRRLPPAMFGAGHYGQRLLVVPSHELVIVRMGHGVDDGLLADAILRIIRALGK